MIGASADYFGFLAVMSASWTVIGLIFLALVFDFVNGATDAANSIATVVSTKVMSPKMAVLWAAVFNFLAVFIFGTAVASTIGKGLIQPDILDSSLIFSALIGAIAWSSLTWYFGLPCSDSHALVGGLVGAGFIKGGLGALGWTAITKTCIFILVAPLLGMVLGSILMISLFWIFRNFTPTKVDKIFRKGQLVSAALYSLGHGGNDAQKTAGIIFGILLSANMLQKGDGIPFWVLFICHIAMGLGTLIGGWRIVKTMGVKLTKLKPVGGFAAEGAGALTLAINAIFGIPASTTHTICGALVGVGAIQKFSAVRWGIASRMMWAWILTIPMSGLIAALMYEIISLF